MHNSITSDSQSYKLTEIKNTDEIKGLFEIKKTKLETDTLTVSSTNNLAVEIFEKGLSFLEETSPTLHSFRLVYEENKTTFVHITVSLPNGSYPRTYTEFKEGVWYTETEINDRNAIYRDKKFVLFFVEGKSFLKLPSGKYTPKYTKYKQQESFSELELELLDISKNSFFKRVDGFAALGVELNASITVFREDEKYFLYGVLYLNMYSFFEENGFFKPHPCYFHIVLSQNLEVGQIEVADVFVVGLLENTDLKLKFDFEQESFVLQIVEISDFVEIQKEPFQFYNLYSDYDTQNSFPVQIFEALVPNSSASFGFFLYPTSVSFNLLFGDFFTLLVIVNFSFETVDGGFGTNQLPIYVEVFNRKLASVHKVVFKEQKIKDWFVVVELTMQSHFYDGESLGSKLEISVGKIVINRAEATVQKVDKYGTGGLTSKQETINNPDSVSHQVAEKLCFYINKSRTQTLMHRKHEENYRSLLQNNRELAKERNQLIHQIAENEKVVTELLNRINEINKKLKKKQKNN